MENIMELQEFANNYFSNFEGEDFYTGEGDEFMDFGGPNQSFATEHNAGRIFVVNLKNELATTENVILLPGYIWKPGDAGNNVLVDGTIKQDGDKKLIGSASPKTIKEFLAFLMKNPTHLNAIRIQSSNPSQVTQQMIYRELSPFKDLESRTIDMGTYTNENTYRDNIVTVPLNIVASSEVELVIPILAGSQTTITFFFGGVLSQSVALKKKVDRATATFARVGVQNVRRLHTIKKALPNVKALQNRNFEGEE